jgi:CRP/FNR family transcriptional regulator, nitrogen fixation regulation protein
MLHQAQLQSRKSSFAPSINPTPKQNLDSPLEMMGSQMRFGRNVEIYGEGEPAEYLYKVVSGAVRTYKVLADGRRQIGGFYLPGDIFGLEASAEHGFSAEASPTATCW